MSRGFLVFSEAFTGLVAGYLGAIFLGFPSYAEELGLIGLVAGAVLAWASASRRS